MHSIIRELGDTSSVERYMPKSLDIGNYPRVFMELADAFEAGKREHVIECEDRHDLLSTRLDMYGFIRALRRDGGIDTHPNFVRVRLYASKEAPWRLTVKHVDDTFRGRIITL